MKLLGCVLLVGAGSAIGFYKAYELKRRVADIIMLQNAFRLLETEIYYTLTPIPAAIGELEQKLPARIQQFFYQVRRAMEQEQFPVYRAWEQSIQYLEQNTSCCAEELSAVRSFGLSLGVGDVQAQQKNFQLLQQRLQHALDSAERNRIQQERVWQYMGVCISLAMVLLLC